MKKLLLLIIPFLMCACKTEEKKQLKKQEEYGVIATEKIKKYSIETQPYQYFYCYSEFLKYDELEETYYYVVHCICYDYGSNYLNFDYIVAINEDQTKIKILIQK